MSSEIDGSQVDIEAACLQIEGAVKSLRLAQDLEAHRRVRIEIALHHHKVRLMEYVRGYAAGRGHLAGGDWDMVNEISQSDLFAIIGDAAGGETAVARVSAHLDELTQT